MQQHGWIARGLATLALSATIVVGSGLAGPGPRMLQRLPQREG